MGQVNYVSVSGNAYRNGFKLGGVNNVINNILSLGYLWDKIRVRGGAYGCFARLVAPSGNMLITTYRDPNISESKKHLMAYRNILKILRHMTGIWQNTYTWDNQFS